MRYKQTSVIIAFVLFFTSSISLFGQITSYPYVEDFESGPAGWTVQGSNTSWELGYPYIGLVSGPASGSNAWATDLGGFYSSNENGWVQSPIFDLSTLTSPYVQLSVNWDSWSDDGAVLQSSIDFGGTWQTIGTMGEEINWYTYPSGWAGLNTYNSSSGGWITAIHSLSAIVGENEVIFRIMFTSDGGSQEDGFGFDLFSILETPCYAGEDNQHSLCSQPGEVDLDQFLSLDADTNGEWTNITTNEYIGNNSTVNLNDEALFNTSVIYIYTVYSENSACEDSAEIELIFDYSNEISDETLTICSGNIISENELENAIGNPQDYFNGYWNVDVSSGIGEEGDYIFTLPATEDCPERSATITVNVDTPRWAGEDNGGGDPVQSCYKNFSLDLNTRLSPGTDLGGTWIKVLGANDMILQASGDVDFPETGAGSYSYSFRYTTQANACGTDDAIVEVNIEVPSDAGSGNSITLWSNESLTEDRLSQALNNADSGGTWNPSEGEPGFGNSGDYSYSFSQGDFGCSNQSIVTVNVVPVFSNAADLKVILQGPYNIDSGLMNDNLRASANIPTSSPYYYFNYFDESINYQDYLDPTVFNTGGASGSESQENDIVDWVIVEFWNNTRSNKIMERPALIQRDGDIVDVDGFSIKSFVLPADDYFIVVNHRNHIPIMTSSIYNLSGGSVNIDFTTNTNLIYGGENAITNFGNGSYGLISGSNNSGLIRNQERVYFYNSLGNTGYINQDYDMNGTVEINDVNNYLIPNLGKGKQF